MSSLDLLAASQNTNDGPMWAVLIVIGVVAFGVWAWQNDKKEREAQARRAAAAEAERARLAALYPDVPESRRAAHHQRVLAQRAIDDRKMRHAAAYDPTSAAIAKRGLAREHGDPTISRREVLRRSGWRCGICGGGIKRSFKWDPDDDRCGTIDHIVPLSRGGQHEWDNVQAAHWGCNQKKGTR